MIDHNHIRTSIYQRSDFDLNLAKTGYTLTKELSHQKRLINSFSQSVNQRLTQV